ncbi:hypothetical protein ACUNFK_22860 [Serratia sp. IR-2025]
MTNAERYLQELAESFNATEVRAGFLGGSTYPDGTPVTVAATAAEYGDPARNQKPRPYFRNAISENADKWSESISRGISSGLDAKNVLEAVGAQIVGDIQESISNLMEPALMDSTLRARRSRGNGSTKPLVDTRVMIGDVNYEVT